MSGRDPVELGDADVLKFEIMTLVVLPEVGCSIDNLEVTKKTKRFAHNATCLERWLIQHSGQEEVIINKLGCVPVAEAMFQTDLEDKGGNLHTRQWGVSFLVEIPKKGKERIMSKLVTLA